MRTWFIKRDTYTVAFTRTLAACMLVHAWLAECIVPLGRVRPSNTTLDRDVTPPSGADANYTRWMDAAYNYMVTLNCKKAFFTSETECRTLLTLSKADVAVYLAPPSRYAQLQYRAILPDRGLRRSGNHDAVLALDPYPQANFGHPVLVFFVDFDRNEVICHREGGIFLGEAYLLSINLYICLFI